MLREIASSGRTNEVIQLLDEGIKVDATDKVRSDEGLTYMKHCRSMCSECQIYVHKDLKTSKKWGILDFSLCTMQIRDYTEMMPL